MSTAFPALESAYFAQREAVLERHARQTEHAQQGQELDVRSSPDDHLQAFSKDLSHFCRHSKLAVWRSCQLPNRVSMSNLRDCITEIGHRLLRLTHSCIICC